MPTMLLMLLLLLLQQLRWRRRGGGRRRRLCRGLQDFSENLELKPCLTDKLSKQCNGDA